MSYLYGGCTSNDVEQTLVKVMVIITSVPAFTMVLRNLKKSLNDHMVKHETCGVKTVYPTVCTWYC